MASGYYKVIFFINHPRGGWSETYYTFQSSLLAAQTAATALVYQRNLLLSPPCIIEGIRVSDELNTRNSILLGYGAPAGFTATFELSDTPWQAQLVRMRNLSSGVQRQLYIRGIPDELWDTQNPTNAIEAVWVAQFNNFFKPAMESGIWYIKGKPRPSSLPHQPIIGWVPGVLENSTLVTGVGASTLNAGQKVTVYQLNGFPRAPGLCLVTSNSPTAAQYTIRLHTPNNFTYDGAAYYIIYAPVYSVIDSCGMGDIVHRIVGRPFGLERGRRRAVRR